MVDDQIKELLMKDKQKEKQNYLSNIHDYSEFIDKNSENPRNTEYMFNILRDIGYLEITGLGVERELIENHRKHFIAHNSQDRGSNAPSYIDFDDLMLGITRYVTMWNEFNKLMPNTQRPGESPDHDNTWDDMWWELKDCALELILCGIDMYAVTRGYDLITQNGDIQNTIWQNFWDDFCHNKDIFYKSLCQDELVQLFYLITDDVNKFLSRNYNHEKSDTFIAFLIIIAESRETYPEDYCYSHVITSDETDSIYQNIKEVFKDYPSSAWFYYYKNALAERTIKHFLRWVCHAKASSMVDTWNIASSSESNHEYKLPNLLAGHNEYSIHMLSHPKNKGWGILKDRLNVLFKPNRQDYKGALFFSMKRYQTGNILVRFENYMPKEELLRLYKTPEKEILKGYYKFSFDDVYNEDRRKEFFQESAMAVMEPVKQPETDSIKEPKDNIIYATNRFKQNIDNSLKETQFIADDYRFLLVAGGSPSEFDIFGEIVKKNIKKQDEWEGLFSSFTPEELSDFESFVSETNGAFCYATIIVYKNNIKFGEVTDLPKEPTNTSIEKELSQNKDCLTIYLGITNKRNKKDFSDIINKYKNMFENNKKPEFKNLKIIQWIKFEFQIQPD